jgi:hypothetical protein
MADVRATLRCDLDVSGNGSDIIGHGNEGPLKEAWSKLATRQQRPGMRRRWSDKRAGIREVHIHQGPELLKPDVMPVTLHGGVPVLPKSGPRHRAERLKAALERTDTDARVFFASSGMRMGAFWSRAIAEEMAQTDAQKRACGLILVLVRKTNTPSKRASSKACRHLFGTPACARPRGSGAGTPSCR